MLPYQEILDFPRIVEIAAHNPRGDDRHVLAIQPRSKAEKALMPTSGLSPALFHRLIPVIVLSNEVPSTGRVRKESVKVCTPESPPTPADYSPLDFATLNVFAHSASAQAQYFRRFAKRETAISNRGRVSI